MRELLPVQWAAMEDGMKLLGEIWLALRVAWEDFLSAWNATE